MDDRERDLLIAFETHDAERIRRAFDDGLDPAAPIDGKSPIDWLVEMYLRSDRFTACLQVLLDRGGQLADPSVVPVLLDDADGVRAAIDADASLVAHRTTMVSSFTPLVGATLLHVAAEYGNVNAARALLDAGADPNARADVDALGLGGHTPIFHTVNSMGNRSLPVMRLLLERGAATDARVDGLTWGKGFEWETTFFDLTPISYCQLGTLTQMHRLEEHVTETVRVLLGAAARPVPPFDNVPNRYLKS